MQDPLIVKLEATLNSTKKERIKRTMWFGNIAVLVMVANIIIDIYRNLLVSATLVTAMTCILGAVLWGVYRGRTKGATVAIAITINVFLVVIAFCEGLKTGGYLYILPLLFAMAFIVGNIRITAFRSIAYFLISFVSYSTCILFCNESSSVQYISPALTVEMFTMNGVLVVVLCTLIASLGVYFEKQYQATLIKQRNHAEQQREHLREIAFVSSHVVRAPLANIMGLTALIQQQGKDDHLLLQELLVHLESSAAQLDHAVKDIVSKANNTTKLD
jgi:signal transduction histidine kinase